jgi:hypothetical protein
MSFNWIIYKELNPDLVKAGLKTEQEYIQHFIKHGNVERRKYNIIHVFPNFNYNIYKQLNPSLHKYSNIDLELYVLRNCKSVKHPSISKPLETKSIQKAVPKAPSKVVPKVSSQTTQGVQTKKSDFNYLRYILYNKLMLNGIYSESEAKNHYLEKSLNYLFKNNKELKHKDYIVTLLGYTKIKDDGSRHTNWFPWNRFKNVFETIGYKCEWIEFENLNRGNEKRIFITWNEPTSKAIYESKLIRSDDIVLQKLTSLGKGMDNINWTSDPYKWCKEWSWPMYKMVENLYDKGVNIYAFGCKTIFNDFPEKKRICEKLKDRIFWISWGGTPFNFKDILNAKPVLNNFKTDINFVGSKWGKVGRGNIDSWEKYITPLEKQTKYTFNTYGGIGNKMVSDNDMVLRLKSAKICPIIHAPSWQAERGIQDRFYTVFISGRFGICDNLGAIDIFGEKVKDICITNSNEYYNKTIYYIENIDKQLEYINHVQTLIKQKYNFYVQWYNILTCLR